MFDYAEDVREIAGAVLAVLAIVAALALAAHVQRQGDNWTACEVAAHTADYQHLADQRHCPTQPRTF